MTLTDKNLMIGNWLGGFGPIPCPDGPSGCESYICRGGKHPGKPTPNFFNDESANALVLEKLPMPLVKRVPTNRRKPPYIAWECWPDPTGSGNYRHVRHVDRKSAICEAAIVYIMERP